MSEVRPRRRRDGAPGQSSMQFWMSLQQFVVPRLAALETGPDQRRQAVNGGLCCNDRATWLPALTSRAAVVMGRNCGCRFRRPERYRDAKRANQGLGTWLALFTPEISLSRASSQNLGKTRTPAGIASVHGVACRAVNWRCVSGHRAALLLSQTAVLTSRHGWPVESR